jgi:hypothetical protein
VLIFIAQLEIALNEIKWVKKALWHLIKSELRKVGWKATVQLLTKANLA